jgi:predicted RNase H-like HicB family nuclease
MSLVPKTLDYYKLLPYTLHAEPVSGGWVAEFVELRGCKTDGGNEAEAVVNLQTLFDDYIQTLIDERIDIPEPEQKLVPVFPFWVVFPPEVLSSSTSHAEDADETEASSSADRFQVGQRETSISYT